MLAPARTPDSEQVARRRMDDIRHPPQRGTGSRDRFQADEVTVPPDVAAFTLGVLVVVHRWSGLGGVDGQQNVAESLRGATILDSLEAEKQTARMPAGLGDREGGTAALTPEHRTQREPALRQIRPHLDRDVAPNTMRSADPADDDRLSHGGERRVDR